MNGTKQQRLIQQLVQNLMNVSSCGDNKEDAIANLKDAIKLMLEPIPEDMYSNDSPYEQVELVL